MSYLTNMFRRRVLYLYKELLYMGKDYPEGYDAFRRKLHGAFRKKSQLDTPGDIEDALDFGEYMKRELITLYSLRTYRSVKRNYY